MKIATTIAVLLASTTLGAGSSHSIDSPIALATLTVDGEFQGRRGSQTTETTDRVSRTVRLGSTGRVSVSNASGSITVTGGSGDQVSIEAVKRTRGDRQLLDDVAVEIAERPGRLEISTDYPNRRSSRQQAGVSVDYTLTIPAQASIEIESASGAITISHVKGAISVESASGTVNVTGAERLEEIETMSGRVELVDSTLEGDPEVSSMSGSILVRNVNAQALRLETVSGRIEASANVSQRLDMSSVSGRLELVGRLSRNGRYSIESHSGTVHLALSGDTGFELEADSFSGSIRSDFPARTTQQTSRDSRGRSRSVRAMRATYGDGSATLEIQTFSGSIVLERR